MSLQGPQGTLLEGWSAEVEDYAIAGGWMQDGEHLVVADASGGVYAFDGQSGSNIWFSKESHEGGVLSMAIHPNRNEFATAGQDGRVLVWEVAEARPTQVIEVGSGWVEEIAWSSDGQWLAAACSRRVSTYGSDGIEAWQSEDHPSTVSAIAWSDTGELASACYGQVAFFDVATGDTTQELAWKGSLVSMVLSPNGDVVACGSQDNSVHFWRRSTGHDSMMSGYPGKPSALTFDDTGTLLATGGGEQVTVWSFRDGGPEGTRPGVLDLHDKPVTVLTFARGSMELASGCREGAVYVWSLQDNGEGHLVGEAKVAGLVAGLCWRPDGGALAALDSRGGVTVWRTA